jgi:glycosyltransferase involved in cell wall biosynthesis
MESEFALCFPGRLSEELKIQGAVVHDLGAVQTRYPWTIIRARRTLGDILHRGRYDVVVCHSPWPQAIFGSYVRRAKTPLVFFLHGIAGGGHWLERWASRVRPNHAICNSYCTQDSLKKMYPGISNDVLYYPVVLAARGSTLDRCAVRAELQIPSDALVIVQVSRSEPWKGHSFHLEALAEIKDVSGWLAWFVGGAQRLTEIQYLAELRSKAQRLGIADRVRFVGERRDIPAILAAADIFCQPNLTPEPFGISFVEALNAGLPVVATAMGGAMEIVDDSCGILVPPDSPTALAEALRELVLSPEVRRRLATGGPARAEHLCAPQTRLQDLAAVLSLVVRSSDGKRSYA